MCMFFPPCTAQIVNKRIAPENRYIKQLELAIFILYRTCSTLLVHTRHSKLEQSMASCISQPPSLVHKKDVPLFSESLKWNPPGGNKEVTPLAFPASSVTCSPKPNRDCTPNVKNKTLFPFILLLLLVYGCVSLIWCCCFCLKMSM